MLKYKKKNRFGVKMAAVFALSCIILCSALIPGCTNIEDAEITEAEDKYQDADVEGVILIYHIDDEEYTQEDVDSAVQIMKERTNVYSKYGEVYYKKSTDDIVIKIPMYAGNINIDRILYLFEQKGDFYVLDDNNYSTMEHGGHFLALANNNDLEAVRYRNESVLESGSASEYIDLTFNDEVAGRLKDYTAHTEGSNYYLFYEGRLAADGYTRQQITNGKIEFTNFKDLKDPETIAEVIRIGPVKLNLSLKLKEVNHQKSGS